MLFTRFFTLASLVVLVSADGECDPSTESKEASFGPWLDAITTCPIKCSTIILGTAADAIGNIISFNWDAFGETICQDYIDGASGCGNCIAEEKGKEGEVAAQTWQGFSACILLKCQDWFDITATTPGDLTYTSFWTTAEPTTTLSTSTLDTVTAAPTTYSVDQASLSSALALASSYAAAQSSSPITCSHVSGFLTCETKSEFLSSTTSTSSTARSSASTTMTTNARSSAATSQAGTTVTETASAESAESTDSGAVSVGAGFAAVFMGLSGVLFVLA
ncbi:hypothetical protein JCM10207_008707 [Rhodosporidiobolus poonsookiae]